MRAVFFIFRVIALVTSVSKTFVRLSPIKPTPNVFKRIEKKTNSIGMCDTINNTNECAPCHECQASRRCEHMCVNYLSSIERGDFKIKHRFDRNDGMRMHNSSPSIILLNTNERISLGEYRSIGYVIRNEYYFMDRV